jgi:hypothetical protein
MVTIFDWLKKFEDLPSVTIHSKKHIEGVCKMVTGARSLFGIVGITLSPSEELVFETSLKEEVRNRCEDEKWIEHICLGVLDVMLTGPPTPINHFRCVIDKIEYHEIDSSKQAFRLAARDATQKFLAQETYNRLWGYGK